VIAVRELLENESDLIVEHRFFRGSRAPHRFVCQDLEQLEAYLKTEARAGDGFYIWVFERCCTDDHVVERGRVPDADGKTPVGGAY
jgi:hypothetical protein